MRHNAAWLRDYLVAGVEDPRLNIQSILSRHFILRELFGSRLQNLMEHEIRFGAVMNWLTALAGQAGEREVLHSVLHALKRQSDNADGVLVPAYVAQTFALLPAATEGKLITNYIEQFLIDTRFEHGQTLMHLPSLETFQTLWQSVLAQGQLSATHPRSLTICEPACGSANDYRFLHSYGLARFVDYSGLDLCAKNIENAKALFPEVHFQLGNVFEIAADDQSFDLCLVHDLFEHLSPEGLHAAVKEVCRVARQGLCIGFFQMDEIAEHIVRPLEEYYWNLLSMARMKELFANHGFIAQVVHIGTFLRQTIGCDQTHNPNAYTFFLRRDREASSIS